MILRFLFATLIVLVPLHAEAQALRTENVIFVTLDGLRWQELFTGADSALIRDERYVRNADRLIGRFWADTPEERRRLLTPFFWEVIAQQGQLYGNRLEGSRVYVTNGRNFSYPGYNEILVGRADDRIDSNARIPNANVTVLEYVHRQEGFSGRVGAFGSWDVFPYIINEERSGIPVNAGFRTAEGSDLSDREVFLNELQPQVPSPWGSVRLDAFTHQYAKEYLKRVRPRLIYIAYGETDDFAHDGRYDFYLTSAYQTDAFIRDLWEWVESTEGYAGRTTLLITTDHGRGDAERWTGHGSDVPGADHIWFAVLGPDTPPLGVVQGGPYYQNQVAATAAAFLGFDYAGEHDVGGVVEEMIGLRR